MPYIKLTMPMPIQPIKAMTASVSTTTTASTASMIRSKRRRLRGFDQMFARRRSCGLYTKPTASKIACAGKNSALK